MTRKNNVAVATKNGNSSFHIVQIIIEKIALLPKETATTLLAIANHYPNAFPSKARISEMIGKSERTIQRDIVELEKAGILVVERMEGRSSRYTIDLSFFEKEGGVTHVSGMAGGESPMSPRGSHPCPGGGVTHDSRKLQTNKQINIGADFENFEEKEKLKKERAEFLRQVYAEKGLPC